MNENKYIIVIITIIVLILFLFYFNESDNFSNSGIHPLNKYFDSVNVVTVPKRKRRIINIMKKFGINVNIINATLVNNINYEKLVKNNFVSSNFLSNKNKGRIACHYSQIKLLQDFIKSNDNTIFIFEDDISLNVPKKYKNIIDKNMGSIPNDWDIVYFGRCWDNCSKMEYIQNKLYKVFSPKCRHAYGLTKKGAMKILKYTLPMTNNGDNMYSNNIKNGNIIAYAIHPCIFNQNREYLGSNIGNDPPFFTKFRLKKNKLINKVEVYPPTCI